MCNAHTQRSSDTDVPCEALNWFDSDALDEPCESCKEEDCKFRCRLSQVEEEDVIEIYTDDRNSYFSPFGDYYQDMADEDNPFRHFTQCIESLHMSPNIEEKLELHVVWFYHDNGECINAYATGRGFVHHDFENVEIWLIGDEDDDSKEEDYRCYEGDDDQTMPNHVDWPFDLLGSAVLWDCSNRKQDWVNYALYAFEVRVILNELQKRVALQPQHVQLILEYSM